MRYVVDLRHPLQALAVTMDRLEGHEKTYVQSSRPWECGNPEGISKGCGKGGEPASWLSMLSTPCHFHGLFLPDDVGALATHQSNEPQPQRTHTVIGR
jgi:hypothetical protein